MPVAAPSAAFAENPLEYELDPYYSNVGLYMSLSNRPIPEITEEDETLVYRQLAGRAFSVPRFIPVEPSVNPLPVPGVYVKKTTATSTTNSISAAAGSTWYRR